LPGEKHNTQSKEELPWNPHNEEITEQGGTAMEPPNEEIL